MECATLIDRYVRHLEDEFHCEPFRDGYMVTTPYLRPDSDAIEIYVHGPAPDGRFVLSDLGETLHYLSSFGPDFLQSRQRAVHLERVARASGADLIGDEIRTVARPDELPQALERLIQVLQEASGLIHLVRPVTRPAFREQVSDFLLQNRVPVQAGYELEGANERWKVDFYVNSRAKAVIEVLTAATSTYAENQIGATFLKVYDLRSATGDLRAFALLDDQEGRQEVWPAQKLAILRQQATVLFWNQRAQLLSSVGLDARRSG